MIAEIGMNYVDWGNYMTQMIWICWAAAVVQMLYYKYQTHKLRKENERIRSNLWATDRERRKNARAVVDALTTELEGRFNL